MFLSSNNVTNSFSQFWKHVTSLYPISVLTGTLGQFVVVKGLPKCVGAHQLCTTQYQLKKGMLNGKRCILSKTGGSNSSLQIIYFAV
jgi:hypothetical protein